MELILLHVFTNCSHCSVWLRLVCLHTIHISSLSITKARCSPGWIGGTFIHENEIVTTNPNATLSDRILQQGWSWKWYIEHHLSHCKTEFWPFGSPSNHNSCSLFDIPLQSWLTRLHFLVACKETGSSPPSGDDAVQTDSLLFICRHCFPRGKFADFQLSILSS